MVQHFFGNCEQNAECGLVRVVHPQIPNLFTGSSPATGYHGQHAPIPLIAVSIEATVIAALAQVQLTQVYVNRELTPIEAIYFFPVDSNGGVTNFRAELDGRTITGVVKSNEEAKYQYEQAVQANQSAFMVERKKADIFKVSVGHLKPGAQVNIVIGYVTEVKNEKGSNSLRFFIPTTVAPRYIPPTNNDPITAMDLRNMNYSQLNTPAPAPLSITVNVSIQGQIKTIVCPTHNVTITPNGRFSNKPSWTSAVVHLNTNIMDMNRDFVLIVTPKDPHTPRLYHEKMDSSNSTAIMAHLIPSFKLDEQKVELIFILDRSGSMMGQSIELAKKALILFLHSAPADSYINIVGFGSNFEFLFPHSVKYDDRSLERAIAHAFFLQANLGGTEIYNPLKQVFEQKQIPGYLRQIFVLTDGAVANTEQVIALIKANSDKARVFSLGIGDSASHDLVEGLAEVGGGTSGFVGYREKFDPVVLQQLKNAIQPSLINVKLTWEGLSIQEEQIQEPPKVNLEKTLLGYGKPVESSNVTSDSTRPFTQVPEKVPPIIDGAQMVVFGTFVGQVPTGLKIDAESPDGVLSINIELSEDTNVGSNQILHKLAAIKTLRELELQASALQCSNGCYYSAQVQALKERIIHLSIDSNVMSKYTSFVAVDSSTNRAMDFYNNWPMQTRAVPSQLPNGWQGGLGCGPSTMDSNAVPFHFGFSSTPNPQQQKMPHHSGPLLFGASSSSNLNFQQSAPNLSQFSFGFPSSSNRQQQPQIFPNTGTFGAFSSPGLPLQKVVSSSAPFGVFGASPSPSLQQQHGPSNSAPCGVFGASSNPSPQQQHQPKSALFGSSSPSLQQQPMAPNSAPLNFGFVSSSNLQQQHLAPGSAPSFGFSSSSNLQQQQSSQNSASFSFCFGGPLSSSPQQQQMAQNPSPLNFGFASSSGPVAANSHRAALSSGQQLGIDFNENVGGKRHEDKLHALVALQSYIGSFPLNDKFCSVISLELGQLYNGAKTLGVTEGAWATAVAVAYFNEKLPELKDSWEMVERKAKKWLTKEFLGSVEGLLVAADNFVKNATFLT